jgi:hypothetical protein
LAAPGHVCVYKVVAGFAGGSAPTIQASPGPYGATSFEIDLSNNGSNWYEATGSWAYQAP